MEQKSEKFDGINATKALLDKIEENRKDDDGVSLGALAYRHVAEAACDRMMRLAEIDEPKRLAVIVELERLTALSLAMVVGLAVRKIPGTNKIYCSCLECHRLRGE